MCPVGCRMNQGQGHSHSLGTSHCVMAPLFTCTYCGTVKVGFYQYTRHRTQYHRNETGFKIKCKFASCTSSYNKVSSFDKHVMRHHSDHLPGSGSHGRVERPSLLLEFPTNSPKITGVKICGHAWAMQASHIHISIRLQGLLTSNLAVCFCLNVYSSPGDERLESTDMAARP